MFNLSDHLYKYLNLNCFLKTHFMLLQKKCPYVFKIMSKFISTCDLKIISNSIENKIQIKKFIIIFSQILWSYINIDDAIT